MIFLFALIFTIIILTIIYTLFWKKLEGDGFIAGVTVFTIFIATPLIIGSVNMFITVIKNIERANYIQAKIQIMQPSGIDEAKLKRAEIEFNTVSNLIKETFNKYQIQAKTEDFKGLKIYTAPFSAGGIQTFQGLGDIERGSGEKLKNLEMLIDKQWQLAEKIIEMQVAVYKPEFYTLNQELHALKYSAFDGILVRWFLKDVQPIYNQEHYANGVNLKN